MGDVCNQPYIQIQILFIDSTPSNLSQLCAAAAAACSLTWLDSLTHYKQYTIHEKSRVRVEDKRKMQHRYKNYVCSRKLMLFILGTLLTILLLLPFFRYLEYPSPGHDAQVDHWHMEFSVGKEREGTFNITAEFLRADSLTRQLADQMTLAKSYVVIAKENNNLHFAWELGRQIRLCQSLLSMIATRGYPLTKQEAAPMIQKLARLIFHAKELHYDCAITVTKLKAQILALEESASANNLQKTTFGQLAAEAIPKGLYCIGIRLTLEYSSNSQIETHFNHSMNSLKFVDNSLYHFCIFSDNVLATSVVVNSTISNANKPERLVFHLVTDSINYMAMRAWFSINNYRGASIEVQCVHDFAWLNSSYVPVLKQLQDADTQRYYFKGRGIEGTKAVLKFRNPKYLSILNHLRFYIPEIYPSLNKVVFLDDDVVVQEDLTPLFSVDLKGNVNGAVETCLETFHRFYKYLNFSHPLISSHFDPEACGWAFGMNVFDLAAWKKANLTSRYHYWQEQNVNRTLWKLGTLPPGLLTFYGLTEPLDHSWHVLGLGYDPNIDDTVIHKAVVVHFNGNMKPWLKLVMPRYKPIWEKYVNYSHPLLQECLKR